MLQAVKPRADIRLQWLRPAWSILSFLALLGVWQLVAHLAASRLFPSPAAVFDFIMREAASGALFEHIGATLARVVVSFVLAMAIGTAIGIVMGRVKIVDQFFDSWLIFFLNLPALVIIVLCYVWFGINETAAIAAVAINKIPNVAVTLREGARSLSRDLSEMAEVYHFGWWKTLRHVTLPQLAPFFAAAARSGLSLVWKIVLVVELFGLSEGVGYQLNVAYQMFDVTMILGYAIAFIVVVQLIETFILQPLDAKVNRWRR
jgi:NitT/TauT family transport system permease protein